MSDSLYSGFEDRFRGSVDEIREKQRVFVPLFSGASDVLDIGCGRGEFLGLLKDHRITARGIDANADMVAAARARGFDVTQADALEYLRSLPDASLGGIIASQVIEHMTPASLLALLPEILKKLRPNAPAVLETINPACWLAFFSSYLRDYTHVWPVHPETLQYLLQATGFDRVELRYSEQAPESVRMRVVDPRSFNGLDPATSGAVTALANAYNANASILNSLLFTYMDYAAIGYKPA